MAITKLNIRNWKELTQLCLKFYEKANMQQLPQQQTQAKAEDKKCTSDLMRDNLISKIEGSLVARAFPDLCLIVYIYNDMGGLYGQSQFGIQAVSKGNALFWRKSWLVKWDKVGAWECIDIAYVFQCCTSSWSFSSICSSGRAYQRIVWVASCTIIEANIGWICI